MEEATVGSCSCLKIDEVCLPSSSATVTPGRGLTCPIPFYGLSSKCRKIALEKRHVKLLHPDINTYLQKDRHEKSKSTCNYIEG